MYFFHFPIFSTVCKLNSRFFGLADEMPRLFRWPRFLLCGEPGQILQLLCNAEGGGAGGVWSNFKCPVSRQCAENMRHANGFWANGSVDL